MTFERNYFSDIKLKSSCFSCLKLRQNPISKWATTNDYSVSFRNFSYIFWNFTLIWFAYFIKKSSLTVKKRNLNIYFLTLSGLYIMSRLTASDFFPYLKKLVFGRLMARYLCTIFCR